MAVKTETLTADTTWYWLDQLKERGKQKHTVGRVFTTTLTTDASGDVTSTDLNFRGGVLVLDIVSDQATGTYQLQNQDNVSLLDAWTDAKLYPGTRFAQIQLRHEAYNWVISGGGNAVTHVLTYTVRDD